jgi:hypothetical protein
VAEWSHFPADVSFWLADCMHFAVENSEREYLEMKDQMLTEGTAQNLDQMLLNDNKTTNLI